MYFEVSLGLFAVYINNSLLRENDIFLSDGYFASLTNTQFDSLLTVFAENNFFLIHVIIFSITIYLIMSFIRGIYYTLSLIE